MKLRFFSILIICIFMSSSKSFAKVTLEKLDEYDKFHRQYAQLYISQGVEKEDVNAFQDAIDKIKNENLHVKYDSVVLYDNYGGLINPARDIGRIIRGNKLSTWVPKESVCASACVEILVAGICRMAQGEVEVHRSFSSYELKQEVSREFLDRQRKKDISYYAEMDMPATFESSFHEVPYWTTRKLTHEEKIKNGLFSTVEYYEVNRMEEVAMNTGISKGDLMKRLQNRFFEINRTQLWKQFISKWTWITFKNDKTKYLKCSEQLFLTDTY